MRIALEIAVSTPDEAVAAERAGADRLELSAVLELGGLTPSLGLFTRVRELVKLPVWVLFRPRAGGFVYSAEEMEVVLRDAELFLAADADGLVFGALDENGCVAEEPSHRILELARGRVTFHRAFDFAQNPHQALERLIGLGFERILTSGGKPTAREGTGMLRELIALAGTRIAVMPGGGIRPENVAELVRATGCKEIHSAARTKVIDPSLSRNPALAGAMGADRAGAAFATDRTLVAGLRRELDRLSSLT